MKSKKFLKILLIFISVNTTTAQSGHLLKKISLSIENETLYNALKDVSRAGDFNFSYNSEIIDAQRRVSVTVENETVKKVLMQLLGPEVSYKSVGNHVVLLINSTVGDSKINSSEEYIIYGHIIDYDSGRKISQATVYEVEGRRNVLTDKEGFFSMRLPRDKENYGISFSKRGYLDTIIVVNQPVDEHLCVILKELNKPRCIIQPKEGSVELQDIHQRQLVNLFVPEESRIMSDNLYLDENRMLHLPFVPYIGTNRKISGSIVNDLSLNIIAGYSAGVEFAELGGFLNIDRGNVKGVQISGCGNIVGKETRGVQMSGFFNLNAGSVRGVQVAGFSNVVGDTLTGMQFSGFNNMLRGKMKGHQISGFSNLTLGSVDGFQVAGGINIAKDDVRMTQLSCIGNFGGNIGGVQASGLLNIAYGDVGSAQISGLANYARSVNGLQLSGLINISRCKNKGAQIASLLNYADTVNGLQLALVNISDTVVSGTPVGLLSAVRRGFQILEFSADETFLASIALKTGVPHFYNIFKASGVGKANTVSFSYGIGTRMQLSRSFSADLDFTSGAVLDYSNSMRYMGLLNRFSPVIDFKPVKSFSLFAGPSVNLYVATVGSDSSHLAESTLYLFLDRTYFNYPLLGWAGGVAGIRFKL